MSSETLGFSHLDEEGKARMVDVGAKAPLRRTAIASGYLRCQPETIARLKAGEMPKGDVFAVARIAGIQSAKRTQDLIPLCHQLPLDYAGVEFEIIDDRVLIEVEVRTTAKTGVEMEALTAVSVAALTLYDMCKAVDKEMEIGSIVLKEKRKEPIE